jgi:hypothetical protein
MPNNAEDFMPNNSESDRLGKAGEVILCLARGIESVGNNWGDQRWG